MFLINDLTLLVLSVIAILSVLTIAIIQVLSNKKSTIKREEHVEEKIEEVNSEEKDTSDATLEVLEAEKNMSTVEVDKASDEEKTAKEEKEVSEELPSNVEDVMQSKRKGKYEIFKDSGFFRYRLKASNGEVLIESELYETEKAVNEAVEIVRKNVENGIYQIVDDKNDSFIYKLSSRNHRTLVVSSPYSTKKGAEDAKEAFKRNALTDTVVYLSDSKKSSKGTMEMYVDTSTTLDDKGLYEVFPNGKKFYFILKNSKGVVLCQSPDFVSKTSCITALENFRSVVYDGVFYICKDKNGKFQFKLYNKQNKLIMTGELLDTKAKVQTVIRNIRKFAKLSNLN